MIDLRYREEWELLVALGSNALFGKADDEISYSEVSHTDCPVWEISFLGSLHHTMRKIISIQLDAIFLVKFSELKSMYMLEQAILIKGAENDYRK